MHKLTEELKQIIITNYNNGINKINIASLVGLSYNTINRFIKSSSVYKTRRELADIRLLKVRSILKSVNTIDVHECINLYTSGTSLRNLCIKYNIGHVKLTKILTDNNVRMRNHSESLSIYKRSPMSIEQKRKISEARLKYLYLNPDKVPYRLWNTHGYISYPHNKVITILTNMNINGWISEYPLSIYTYDIAFPELKLDIEIDGSTHTRPESIIADTRRDVYSVSQGWTVLRFPASKVVNDTTNVIDTILETILSINSLYLSNFDNDKWAIQKQNYLNYKLNIHKKIPIQKQCVYCSVDFYTIYNQVNCCSKSCGAKNRYKHPILKRPSIDILIDNIKSSSYVAIGKEYGVSDNAIRKWVKAYGIDPKTLMPVVST